MFAGRGERVVFCGGSPMGYIEFIKRNALFVAFGLLMVAGSSFGQTFFVGVFGGAMMQDLGLSHSAYGTLYSAATLVSGFLIFWAGRLVDVVDLRVMAVAVLLGLAGASYLTGQATSPAMLAVAFFGLRFFGQGLSSHTAMTAMARYFDDGRGKALSLASLGFPIGNGVWPIIGVAVLVAYGWRQSFTLFAATIVLVFVPLVLLALKGQSARHTAWAAAHKAAAGNPHIGKGDWTRPQVMRDLRYWAVQAMNMTGPFFMTGFLFHQVHIAGAKGWTLAEMATGMVGFAMVSFTFNLLAGAWADRLGAARLVSYTLLPMIAAATMLAWAAGAGSIWLYLLPMGITAGVSLPVSSSLWADMYGTGHLGAIKAMNGSIMVLASSASPLLFGALFDMGWNVPMVAATCIGWSAATSLLVFGIRKTLSGRAPE